VAFFPISICASARRLPRGLPDADRMFTLPRIMRLLRTLLLVAALLGLAGQATAIAAVPLAAQSSEAASTMTEDCMEMMSDSEEPQSLPCDGSFKCMLAMGCLSLNAMAELSSPRSEDRARSTQGYWPAVVILQGASFAPDPHPPSTFG